LRNETPLLEAIERKHPAVIKALVKANVDPDAVVKWRGSNASPLEIAIELGGHPVIMQALFEAKANPNNKNEETATTLLSKAVMNSNSKTVELLLKAKASLDEKSGANLLLDVITYQKAKIIETLIEAKVNPNIVSEKNMIPLNYAISIHNVEIVNALLKGKADPDKQIKSCGTTPLHSAVLGAINSLVYSDHYQDYSEIIEVLLQAKANPNIVDVECETPFVLACKRNDDKITKTLFKGKSDVHHQNKSALDYAIKNKNLSNILLLLEAGVEINNPDSLMDCLSLQNQHSSNVLECLKICELRNILPSHATAEEGFNNNPAKNYLNKLITLNNSSKYVMEEYAMLINEGLPEVIAYLILSYCENSFAPKSLLPLITFLNSKTVNLYLEQVKQLLEKTKTPSFLSAIKTIDKALALNNYEEALIEESFFEEDQEDSGSLFEKIEEEQNRPSSFKVGR
jgi:ankyrin repeat protein